MRSAKGRVVLPLPNVDVLLVSPICVDQVWVRGAAPPNFDLAPGFFYAKTLH